MITTYKRGQLWIISKSIRKTLSNISVKHDIYKPLKTAVWITAHIIYIIIINIRHELGLDRSVSA